MEKHNLIPILISTNNYKGILEIERQNDTTYLANINYYNLGKLQGLDNFKYDSNSGEMSFSKGEQKYDGVLSNSGSLVGKVSFKNKEYSWVGRQFMVKEYPIREVWRITANNYKALLTIEQEKGHHCKGTLVFDELAINENLEKIYYGTQNGMIHFVRSKGKQIFEAEIIDNKMRGIFISDSRKYNWEGYRVDNALQPIQKKWRIKIENHQATLEYSADSNKSAGIIKFDELNKNEILDEIYFNPITEKIFFKRKNQIFDGAVINHRIYGSFFYQGSEYSWGELSETDDDSSSSETSVSKKRKLYVEAN